MKPGDRIYWLRHIKDTGSRARLRVPAIFLGFVPKERESCYVYIMEDGEVVRRKAKTYNMLPRTEDKEIDVAAVGRSHYCGPALTGPQLSALGWLRSNGGLEVLNMNMDGKAKEWPAKATINTLIDRGLVTFEQQELAWKVEVNQMGEAVLREHTL